MRRASLEGRTKTKGRPEGGLSIHGRRLASCGEHGRPPYLTVTVTQPDRVPDTPGAVFLVQNVSLPLKPAAGV